MSEKYLGENSTPILINQIKDKLEENYKVMGELGAKNLIPYPYESGTIYVSGGITYTANSDGSIIANGTSTGYSHINLYTKDVDDWKFLNLKVGEYKMTLYADDYNKITQGGVGFLIRFSDGRVTPSVITDYIVYADRTTECTVAITQEMIDALNAGKMRCEVRIFTSTNTECDNVTVYPMLRYASDTDNTWQPYAPTNKEIADVMKIIDISNSFYTELAEGISLSDVAVYKQGKHIFGSFLMNGLTTEDGVKLYLTYAPKLKTHTFCSIYNVIKNVVLNTNGTLYVQGASGVGHINIDYVCI